MKFLYGMVAVMGVGIVRGEWAGIVRTACKARLYLADISGIQNALLVRCAVERPHRRLRHAAPPAIGGVAEQHDFWTGIGLPGSLEDFGPAIVDLTQNAGDHGAHLVGRRARLGGARAATGVHARRRTGAYGRGGGRQVPRWDVQGGRCNSNLSTPQRYRNPLRQEVIEGVRAFHARRAERGPASPPAAGYSAESLQMLFGKDAV